LRPYLKNTQHKKELAEWLKWYSTCLASVKPSLQTPVPPKKQTNKQKNVTGRWWLTPVILVTQEAEIRRIEFQSQPRANSSGDPI
jgi:hypothetical protein